MLYFSLYGCYTPRSSYVPGNPAVSGARVVARFQRLSMFSANPSPPVAQPKTSPRRSRSTLTRSRSLRVGGFPGVLVVHATK